MSFFSPQEASSEPMSTTDCEEEVMMNSDDDVACVVSSAASSDSDGEARKSKRARSCLKLKTKTSFSKTNFTKVSARRTALPDGLLGSDAELESDDAEDEGYEPLEIAPLLTEAASIVDTPATPWQPDSLSDFPVIPPNLPGHQQCAAHVLHHVSVDVDNALSSLAGEELEGRPASFLCALTKLGQLWRVKRESSLVSIEFLLQSLNSLYLMLLLLLLLLFLLLLLLL